MRKTINKKIIFSFLSVAFLALAVLAFQLLNKSAPVKETAKKIVIKDKENQISLNDKGVVELKNPEKVIYQNWSDEKIKALFEFMRQKSKSQNEDFNNGDISVVYFDGEKTYRFFFNEDDSYLSEVFKVTKTNKIKGYSVPGQGLGEEGEGGCRWLYQLISSEQSLGSYSVSEKPIIFAEDHLWVEGTVNGKITVIAASFPLQSSNKNIWIRSNLVYKKYDGSNNLGLIAQNNIYFVRDVPDNFRIDGALIAQKGNIIRHGYLSSCGGTQGALKNKLTIYGSIISYFKSYWNFNDPPISGFVNREITYDSNLLYQPPPYFPTSGSYEFISWKEE